MTSVSLLTQRCWIRPVQSEDHRALYDATRYEGFTRWLSWAQPDDEAAVAGMVARQIESWNAGSVYSLFVVERAANVVVGGVDLKRMDDADARCVLPQLSAGGSSDTAPVTVRELGYWTHPARQGLGYASEFVPAVVRWAFEVLRVHALVAAIGVDNEPSRRLVHRLGFEEFDRRHVCGAVKRFENVRYRLLSSAWEGRGKA